MENIDKNLMASGVSSDINSEVSNNRIVFEDKGIEITVIPDMELNSRKEGISYSSLTHVTYYSKTCEKNRGMNIQIPSNYSKDKKYPVMYVLHGIFGDENSMCGDGKSGIPALLDNLMASGVASQMIVVYPFMFASKDKDQCEGFDMANTIPYDNFINELVNDIMPYMKNNYSILEGKTSTAVTGFSMGGRESIAIGLMRPDLFGFVGSIAPAPGLVPTADKFMTHAGQFKVEEMAFKSETPNLFMVCAGDSDSVVGTYPLSYHEIFDTNKVDHIWWEVPGSDHGDPAISSGIYNFAKYIFK